MPRAHQAGLSRRSLAGVGLSESILCHGPGLALLNNEGVQQHRHDEAPFWLNAYVNKQNCHIWSEANSQVYVETPLHPEKLTVWCALWAGGIIGQYFFKNDKGHNVTVNGDQYRVMITNFFIPELNNHHVQELWFQQDGCNMSHCSCHNRFIERHVW
ncbi:transposable element Tc3 transposase [Trichonephila clavipes]|nr:transposable element Tc3 transposase [Trichonephila clavipes]